MATIKTELKKITQDEKSFVPILTRIEIDGEQEIVNCAIGQYDGLSDDDDIFFWFEDINQVIGKHSDFEALDFEIDNGQLFGFEHEGTQIMNPLMDETGRFDVEPTLYYKDAYNEFMIKKHTAIFNEQLKHLGLNVDIFETSELYGQGDEDIDETNPYYDLPMYEARIEDENEEEIDDTCTGRFCDISSVVEELEGYVLDVIEKAIEIARAKAGEDACFDANMPETNFQGTPVATEENWDSLNGEFSFSNNETGSINEDGTVFYDSEGLNQYIFANKADAFEYLFEGAEVSHKHSFYIGSREEHPTLDGWCKRMGIGVQKEEDGSSVWSAWKNN